MSIKLLIFFMINIFIFKSEEDSRLVTCAKLYEKSVDEVFKLAIEFKKNGFNANKMNKLSSAINNVIHDCYYINYDNKKMDLCLKKGLKISQKLFIILKALKIQDWNIISAEGASLGMYIINLRDNCFNKNN